MSRNAFPGDFAEFLSRSPTLSGSNCQTRHPPLRNPSPKLLFSFYRRSDKDLAAADGWGLDRPQSAWDASGHGCRWTQGSRSTSCLVGCSGRPVAGLRRCGLGVALGGRERGRSSGCSAWSVSRWAAKGLMSLATLHFFLFHLFGPSHRAWHVGSDPTQLTEGEPDCIFCPEQVANPGMNPGTNPPGESTLGSTFCVIR